ncbi:MAG: hypothetical protein ABI907_06635 [Ramlibacter sp.]
MGFTTATVRGPKFVAVEVTGLAFVEDAAPLLKALEADTRLHGDKRLLINLLDVVGTLGGADHDLLGKLASRHLAHLEKVASLVPGDKITRVSERSAQLRGLHLMVFTSLVDAVEWLTD